MKEILFILFISSIVALISTIFQITGIIMVLGLICFIIFVVYCYKNTNKCFWAIYFFIMSLPISKNNIMKYITINIGHIGINMMQICIGIIFIVIVLKNYNKKRIIINTTIGIEFLILCMLYLLYLVIGIKNNGSKAISDLDMYIFHCLLFYCTYKIVDDKDDIYKLLNITFYALTVSCSLSLVMLITNKLSFWGISYDGGRYGGNFITMLIVTVSYIVFLVYNREKRINKVVLIYSIIIFLITIILSQNRTNPILLAISCLIILCINIKYKLNRKIYNKLAIIIVVLIFGGITIGGLASSNSDFVNRFKNISSFSQDTNIKTRTNTNKYHLNLIKEKPLGSGFGTLMPFVDSRGIFRYEDSLNIDNTYITIARKTGIITTILYICIILSPIILLIKIYQVKKDNIYISSIVFYSMLIIAGSIMTSQSIHSYAVSSFIWVFISLVNVEWKKIRER